MAKKRKKSTRRKGFFSDLRLPVSAQYIYPKPRTMMLLIGGVACLLLIGAFTYNLYFQQGTLISNGPLSSNHAEFGQDCSTCHTPFEAVTNVKCEGCHEKYGNELGSFSFASHYLYQSGDFRRTVSGQSENEAESACYTCHVEHVGWEAQITRVADNQCLTCHAYGSFNDGHPEFDFAAENTPDDANLKFPHTLHVNQVMGLKDLSDHEAACVYCHNADAEGQNFQDISFDLHCASCHLTGDGVENLTLGSPTATDNPGVIGLSTIRSQRRPGATWAFSANAGEYDAFDGTLSKTPVYHADPWILENLKQLRRVLYPGSDLTDLLNASGNIAAHERDALYQEAIENLRAHAEGLRANPNLQDDLTEVEQLITQVERRLKNPYSPLDETKFLVSASDLNADLSEPQVQAYETLIGALTQPCQECHVVQQASITRAQTNQRTLVRARFDHRAHIIQQRCLDCHAEIPIADFAGTNDRPDAAQDHAGIQNLPRIASCQTCHAPDQASNACITCHDFHPDKSHRSNLLLYLDQ